MVLISIIVGLGITHILVSLSNAVHRLRHHGRPIRLEVTYLTWVAFIFTWLLNFWWWEFKWNDLTSEFGVGLFMFLALYAMALFSLVVFSFRMGRRLLMTPGFTFFRSATGFMPFWCWT